MKKVRLKAGTRGSRLALWQTNHVIRALQQAWPEVSCQVKVFETRGDKILGTPLPQIGGKGLFTDELGHALHRGDIDFAVHSLKDLPTNPAQGLTLGAIMGRTSAQDVLVARNPWTLKSLPEGAVVGTSSHRRTAQLLHFRPDLTIKPIRGNIDTRVQKVLDGQYDSAVLAAIGLERLGLTEHITEYLDLDLMLPAAGQGALAVQCREEDEQTLALLAAFDSEDDRRTTEAERVFLSALGGGCSTPIAAYAHVVEDGLIVLQALIGSLDGQTMIRVQSTGVDGRLLGAELARAALQQGAEEVLSHV